MGGSVLHVLQTTTSVVIDVDKEWGCSPNRGTFRNMALPSFVVDNLSYFCYCLLLGLTSFQICEKQSSNSSALVGAGLKSLLNTS